MSSSLHFFTIPVLDAEAAQDVLNQFLVRHRVVALEKQWLAAGIDSHWAVCVTVAAGQAPLPQALKLPSSKGARVDKVDYREILHPDDFAVFAKLRALRLSMSTLEGVPPYVLFTNEQLAEMARQRPANVEALRRIDGVGELRMGKYGAVFLAALHAQDGA